MRTEQRWWMKEGSYEPRRKTDAFGARQSSVMRITSGTWQQPSWPLGCPRDIRPHLHHPHMLVSTSRPIGRCQATAIVAPGRQSPSRLHLRSDPDKEDAKTILQNNPLSPFDGKTSDGSDGYPSSFSLPPSRPGPAAPLGAFKATRNTWRASPAGAVCAPPSRSSSHGYLFIPVPTDYELSRSHSMSRVPSIAGSAQSSPFPSRPGSPPPRLTSQWPSLGGSAVGTPPRTPSRLSTAASTPRNSRPGSSLSGRNGRPPSLRDYGASVSQRAFGRSPSEAAHGAFGPSSPLSVHRSSTPIHAAIHADATSSSRSSVSSPVPHPDSDAAAAAAASARARCWEVYGRQKGRTSSRSAHGPKLVVVESSPLFPGTRATTPEVRRSPAPASSASQIRLLTSTSTHRFARLRGGSASPVSIVSVDPSTEWSASLRSPARWKRDGEDLCAGARPGMDPMRSEVSPTL